MKKSGLHIDIPPSTLLPKHYYKVLIKGNKALYCSVDTVPLSGISREKYLSILFFLLTLHLCNTKISRWWWGGIEGTLKAQPPQKYLLWRFGLFSQYLILGLFLLNNVWRQKYKFFKKTEWQSSLKLGSQFNNHNCCLLFYSYI